MRTRFGQWIFRAGKQHCSGTQLFQHPNPLLSDPESLSPLRRKSALALLAATTALTPGLAVAAPLANSSMTPHVITYAAFIGTLVFAVVSGLTASRTRRRIEAERNNLANELGNIRAQSERFESLIRADDQRFLIWSSSKAEPTVTGQLPEQCAAPQAQAEFVRFGSWLAPASAAGLERHIAALRSQGSGFQIAITTKAGNYLDAYGRTAGGRAFVRFRDLSGDQQVILQLQRQLAEKSTDVKNFQALLEAVEQPVWLRIWAENGESVLQWANQAYHAAIASADATASSSELLDSDARAAITQANKAGDPFKKRVHAVSNGQRRTFDVVSVPTESGSAGIATDVSDTEKAQAALGRTIKSHETTFNELATAVAIFDKSHRLTFHNKAYRELFGLDGGFLASAPSDSEVIDKLRSLEKLPVEANFRQWKSKLLKVHQDLELSEFTWHLPDGQTLRVVASPRSTGGVTWIYEDMTARLNLESRVNVLSRLQGETLNRLTDGVAVFSSDGKLTLSNTSFMNLWNIDNTTLDKQLHINALAAVMTERFACDEEWHQLKMAIVGVSEKRDEASGTMERPDGLVIRYSTNALIDGRTMVTFVDITDSINFERALTEKNEALYEADKLKTDFVKHVNYELRSPLTNIIGFAQLLSDADIGPLNDKQQEYTRYILSSSSSLLAIINDILDLATADAGVMELSLSDISVEATIAAAIEGLKDRLVERRITLKQSIAADVSTFTADQRRVIQILFNLLSNAIQFSDEDGTVALTVTSDGENVIFEVQDWGAGIPDAFIDHVFNRFESRSSGRSRGGAGLGLSIVQRFVELHNGEVSIDSEEGKGTRITCILPARPHHYGLSEMPELMSVASE